MSRTNESEGVPGLLQAPRRLPETRARLSWYWNRLRRMSAPEVGYRFLQKAGAKAEQYGVAGAHKVPAADVRRRAEPFVLVNGDFDPEPYIGSAERLLDGRMVVLGREYVFADVPEWNRDPRTGIVAPLAFGRNLDYRDGRLVGDIKFLWEINRHLDLVVLAQAYRLTGDGAYLSGLRRFLDSWLTQCPYPRGPNWTSALELAIRVINWSIVWQLIGGADSPMFRWDAISLRSRWLEAIYRHLHFIQSSFSRFSSANNHLIGEAAGLYIGALMWPLWPAAARWRRRARHELVREALRQNAEDGVNREQAVAYQRFVIEFLLLAALAGRANGDDFPVGYWRRLEQMLEFIAAIMDVGGNVPMFGDSDDGAVVRLCPADTVPAYRSLLAAGAAIYGRPDFKAKAKTFDDGSAWLLGDQARRKFEALPPAGRQAFGRAFREGGYYVLGHRLETPDEVRIIADAGPLGYRSIAAHGHADALSFTLSIGGTEILVDPGTYVYHTDRRWRDYFRGTAAHNTVRVDGMDQSVIGGAFMWTRHARAHADAWQSDELSDRLLAWHDGYERLSDPVRHVRELVYDKRFSVLEVSDLIECRGRHRIECSWHFAEDVIVTTDADGAIRAKKDGHELRLVPGYPLRTNITVCSGDDTRPAGWVSRRFNEKRPTTTVVWSCEISGTTRLNARLECRAGGGSDA